MIRKVHIAGLVMQIAENGGPTLTYRSAPIGAEYLNFCGSMRRQQFNSAGMYFLPSKSKPNAHDSLTPLITPTLIAQFGIVTAALGK